MRILPLAIVLSMVAGLPAHQSDETKQRDAPRPRAMWVWDADPPLADRLAREELLGFCRSENIGTLWMQVSDLDDRAAEWRSLIADVHGRGLRIHALDGAPFYALKDYHEIPLALVDTVIAFNDGGRSDERFDGIHFDNEPYLLPGWSDPAERSQILAEYLALNTEAARRVRAQSTMEIGVDIPFWWPNEVTVRLVDLLDNVGIMDYRNVAEGSDGLIAHALALLSYATQATSGRRARIIVGVETSFTEPRTFWFAAGLPSAEFRRIAGRGGRRIPRTIGGFQTKTVSAGGAVHVGLAWPGDSVESSDEWQTAMREVVRSYGAAARTDRADGAERAAARAIADLRADAEWIDERARPIAAPDGRVISAGFQATAIMLPKLTFAVKSIDEMRRELAKAEAVFERFSGYGGIAIHHYESYRTLYSRPRTP